MKKQIDNVLLKLLVVWRRKHKWTSGCFVSLFIAVGSYSYDYSLLTMVDVQSTSENPLSYAKLLVPMKWWYDDIDNMITKTDNIIP